jgi:hypothetical protein
MNPKGKSNPSEIVIAALHEHVGRDVKVIWQEAPTAPVASDAKAVTAETCQR